MAPLGQAALLGLGFQVLCAAGPARVLMPGPWPRRDAVTEEKLSGGVAVATPWCWGWLGVMPQRWSSEWGWGAEALLNL